jgi:hypothetical protein
MMSPQGTLGMVPDEHVDAAIVAGFRPMTPADMRAMYQASFMEHALFKDKHKPVERRRRKSLLLRRTK